MQIIKSIKKMVSYEQKRNVRKFLYFFENINNAVYDCYKYLKYSSSIKNYHNVSNLEAMLFKECHRIEKGMSLSSVRMGFGEQAIERIYANVIQLLKVCDHSVAIDYAGSIIRKYIEMHKDTELNDSINVHIEKILSITNNSIVDAGVLNIQKNELLLKAKGTFDELVSSRHSVRQYTSEVVDKNILQDAAKLASTTPSVCNRQAFKVRFYTEKQKINGLLQYQNGNKAFREEIPVVAVISVDLRFFEGAGERNQSYVDGGLFAMSLVYALHFHGLGTCFLNWSVKSKVDTAFRRISLVPKNEVIITLLSIGHMKDTFKVAVSPNKDFSDLYTLIED